MPAESMFRSGRTDSGGRTSARPELIGEIYVQTQHTGCAESLTVIARLVLTAHRSGEVPMFWKTFASVFATVFLAEIGDKTQLATMLFASDRQVSRVAVFAGAAGALMVAAAVGVLVGSQLERFVSPAALRTIAGIGFIVIGIWTLASR